MQKNKIKWFLAIISIIAIAAAVIFALTVIDYIKAKKEKEDENSTKVTYSENIDLENITGNDTIITVDDDSSIRIIKEYDENMFKGHKSLVFFWASWCSHCREEYDVVKTAISEYQNRGYTIYVISHDYSLDVLADFMKNEDFNYEVYFDEGRVIRKKINPEASSVPLTYILDENCNLIDSFSSTITLEELNDLMNRNI